jgi:hypothetical protein
MAMLARCILRVRFLSWSVALALAAILWGTGRPVQFEQSIEGFFPPGHSALRDYRAARQAFGSDDIVFVVYDDEQLWTPAGMDRVGWLADKLQEPGAGVERVDSLDAMPLPWRVDAAAESRAKKRIVPGRLLGGFATVGHEVRANEDRPEALERLRQRVCSSPLFRNVLVDSDGRTTALVVRLNDHEVVVTDKDVCPTLDPQQAVAEIRRRADAFGDEHGIERIAVVGPPVLLADGFASLQRDNRTLGLVAMGLMSLTMLVSMRSLWWALVPLVSGWTTWLLVQAFLNTFQLKLALSSGPIIAQTVVLCMPAASHLAMNFLQSLRRVLERDEAARHTLGEVATPVLWCSLTAAAGYVALVTSTVRPVFQFGLTMTACNLLAGLLAYGLSAGAMQPPRWLRRERLPVAQAALTEEGGVGRLTAWVIGHPGRTLTLFVVPCLAAAVGISWLEFESNYIRIYRSRARVARDYRFVESRLGGIGLVELVVPAPEEITPGWIKELRGTAEQLRAVDPEMITEVLTLADMLARPKPEGSPLDDEVLKIKLRGLAIPAYSHFLDNFWNRSSNLTRLIVRIREDAPAHRKQQAFAELSRATEASLGVRPTLTGISHLMTQVTQAVIATQFQSTGLACAIILVMLGVALRSVRLAVLALLPTVLAIGLVLGTMGLLGIRIDLSTALVASVAAGLAVDDTFHCLLRWQRHVRSGVPPADALRTSYAGAGPGVVLSSAAVSLGFFALVFSEFLPTVNFGWLLAVATLGGSLGNLIVLPACLALWTKATKAG